MAKVLEVLDVILGALVFKSLFSPMVPYVPLLTSTSETNCMPQTKVVPAAGHQKQLLN